MNLGLEGRRAVVTGGSAGIGFAVARALVREGAEVLIGARDPDRLEAARAALERERDGARVLAQVLDVTDASSLAAFADHATAKLGDPDVLVTNAGGPPAASTSRSASRGRRSMRRCGTPRSAGNSAAPSAASSSCSR